MLFNPQKYLIEDKISHPFISANEICDILTHHQSSTLEQVEAVVARSMNHHRLSLEEVATLLNCGDAAAIKLIFDAARKLKNEVYGKRIVIFAPLYIGNHCINNCAYCGFRVSNREAVRLTLDHQQICNEVRTLEATGQKRLILVYGEHPKYNAEYIADTVKLVYGVHGEDRSDCINRVNINAAPFDTEGFRIIKEAGIGTYQIFQETYNPESYAKFHPSGRKADYNWRLTALDRAMQAGIDDVGLGVLFGLGDWRFEVMALVRHTNHLEACFGVGPHTISFPRIKKASNIDQTALSPVSDEDFMLLVAILRLAVPYTGLILTARENRQLRNRLIEFGVSQIDAGTQLEIGGYTKTDSKQDIHREQFELADTRSLAQTVDELMDTGEIPSFCTACYRKGRTGEHFMEFSTKGFIKRFCTPNALLTFAEYLEDYATQESKAKGWSVIEQHLMQLSINEQQKIAALLTRIKAGERDLLL